MRMAKAVTAATLFVTTTVPAQPEEAPITANTPSFHLGLRAGYSLPMGNTVDSNTASGLVQTALSDGVSGAIPLIMDLGYRVTPHLLLGIYGQYGYVFVKKNEAGCPSIADCSGADYRFGIEGRYDISPRNALRPWFGLGIGYEILSANATFSGYEYTRTFWGFEFVNLQAGADFAIGKNLAIGPFAQFSVGQFSKTQTSFGGGSQAIKGTHEWLTLGIAVNSGF